jgi:arylmalonate decarboxylase
MKIGLVVPTAEDRVPAEGAIMYPDVEFIPKGTGVGSLTPEGYDKAAVKIVPAAEALYARGDLDAIMLFGTSLTFYRGPQFNEDLQAEVRKRTGLPVSSMSTAIVDGLRAVGAKRVAVTTAYSKVVNDRLIELLEFHGFTVESLCCFGITEFGGAVSAKTEGEIIELAGQSRKDAPKADAMVISCGGLRTLGVTKPLEDKHGLPVVSSTPASFWAAVRLAGHSGKVAGYGSLLEGKPIAAAAK